MITLCSTERGVEYSPGWYCNFCGLFYQGDESSYHCPDCHYDCCVKCYDRINTIKPNVGIHPHILKTKWTNSCGVVMDAVEHFWVQWRSGSAFNAMYVFVLIAITRLIRLIK